MSVILFGSISTLVDTSELQRAAFNEAFSEHDLDWHWDQDEYRDLLTSNGGADRIAAYAEARGEEVDAAAIHRTKSERFLTHLEAAEIGAREGVADVIRGGREQGVRFGLVTTTSPENVEAILAAAPSAFSRDDFDVVLDATGSDAGKPDPASYRAALDRLAVDGAECVAIEDNVGGVQAAQAAGVRCIAFPNENTAGHDFGDAPVAHALDLEQLAGSAERR